MLNVGIPTINVLDHDLDLDHLKKSTLDLHINMYYFKDRI